MTDDFWGPVFAKLHEDIEFLRQVGLDTPDKKLVEWVRPNPVLWPQCAPYIRKGKVTNKAGLVDKILQFAAKEQSLRKLILFNWVETNPKTMQFPTLPIAGDMTHKLASGDFGSPEKIKILAQIDPRAGAKPVYDNFFASLPACEQKPDADQSEISRLRQKLASLEANIEELKAQNNQLQKIDSSKNHEIKLFHQNLDARHKRIVELEVEVEKLNQKNISLQHRISEATSASTPVITAEDQRYAAMSEECQLLREHTAQLQSDLHSRDRTIERLNDDIDELKAFKQAQSDAHQQIANLQRLLEQQETNLTLPARFVAGQLIARYRSDSWLFVSVESIPFLLSKKQVLDASLVPEELALLCLNEADDIITITSLESDNKEEMFGFIQKSDNQLVLVCDDQTVPVQINLPGHIVSQAVRATVLSEYRDRPRGVYFAARLNTETEAQPSGPTKIKHKTPIENDSQQTFPVLAGKKVLIFGGDRIGAEYERYFGKHSLDATWHSGFTQLGALRTGLGNPDAVVIVLKQISHTLLREIIPVANEASVPLVFSERRGLSGVRDKLISFFSR